MKKLIIPFIVFLLCFSFSTSTDAKSYSIDKIHIKSWIQPNGDLLVNEVYTYNFVGEFSSLRRSFPKIHMNNVVDFYAYELAELDPEPGFIEDDTLRPLVVSKVNGIYKTNILTSDKKVSFLYAYTLKNSITAYDSYGNLNVVYFDQGDAHDQDYNQLTIDYIFPESMHTASFEGVLYDRNASKSIKSQYGIRFQTPISEAFTETKTSFVFPSSVISGMKKSKAPMSLEDALANEKVQQKNLENRLFYIEKLIKLIPKVSFAILILAILLFFLLPQRHFWRKGSEEDIMNTDILYLFFIDNIGKPHRKAFLAGLFSMVEKDIITVTNKKSAVRFSKHLMAPKETLDFQLVKRKLPYAFFEKYMIDWLFQSRSGSSRWAFHLHDIAGVSKNEKNSKKIKEFYKSVKDFKGREKEWHRLVEKELKEAGTLSNLLPLIVTSLVTIVLNIFLVIAYYADLHSIGSIVLILGVTTVFLIMHWMKKWTKWIYIIYFSFSFIVTGNIVNENLMSVVLGLICAIIVLFLVLPRNILSMNALRCKDAIRDFRKSIKSKSSVVLSQYDEEKWAVRAYLLGNTNKRIPKFETTNPLATLLLTGPDPLEYVNQSWKWTKVSNFTSSDGSISSSGGSSDGGDGGGAGAD